MMMPARYQLNKSTARSIAMWCTVRQHVVFCLTSLLLKMKFVFKYWRKCLHSQDPRHENCEGYMEISCSYCTFVLGCIVISANIIYKRKCVIDFLRVGFKIVQPVISNPWECHVGDHV